MDCGSKDCKGYSESHKNNCTASDMFDEPTGCVGYTPLTTEKDAVADVPCDDGLCAGDIKPPRVIISKVKLHKSKNDAAFHNELTDLLDKYFDEYKMDWDMERST